MHQRYVSLYPLDTTHWPDDLNMGRQMPHFGKKGQPYAEEAKQWLTNYAHKRWSIILPHRRDHYGRIVIRTRSKSLLQLIMTSLGGECLCGSLRRVVVVECIAGHGQGGPSDRLHRSWTRVRRQSHEAEINRGGKEGQVRSHRHHYVSKLTSHCLYDLGKAELACGNNYAKARMCLLLNIRRNKAMLCLRFMKS